MYIVCLWRHLSIVVLHFFIVVYFLFIPICADNVDEKARFILEKTSAFYQGLENFRATYKLVVEYPTENFVQKSKITITACGQQYRLCYDQKETITDGETVWVYDEVMKEVTISDYATTDCSLNFAELYNLYQEGYASKYVGMHVVNKKKRIIRDLIKLVPDDKNSDITNVILEIDRSTSQIYGWKILQNDHVEYSCTLCSFDINVPLSDDYFKFDFNNYDVLETIDLREPKEDQQVALT